MRVVEVTYHALVQFRIRFPSEDLSNGHLRLQIAREVNDALDYGRYATRQPKWAQMPGKRIRGMRSRNEVDRTLRYVWTEEKTRMYLVDRSGAVTRVVTSILPGA